jgi:hypothetical protein
MKKNRKQSRSAATQLAPHGFTPVSVKARHDGWSPQVQVSFIECLADTGSVSQAATQVDRAVEGAYRLRRRPDGEAFAAAWDAALAHATHRLVDAAYERALHGVAHPIIYKGEQVGERRQYSDALLMFLLRNNDPTHFGVLAKPTLIRWQDIRAEKAGPMTMLLDRIWPGRKRQKTRGDTAVE